MIVSSALDYRQAAQRRLPRFLFDYIDGGANAEDTLQANVADLRAVNLRQRVLKNVSDLSLATEWFGQRSELPVILGPVGLSGMFARRGEVQAARAAAKKACLMCCRRSRSARLKKSRRVARARSGFSSMC